MTTRDRIARLSTRALEALLNEPQDDETLDAIYDELEARQLTEEIRDHMEEDHFDAFSERYELWRREF